MRVAFVHPDLGIGGAERLIVDAALALQAEGHEPTIFTGHFDPTRSFSELLAEPPLVKFEVVRVRFVPRSIFGRCQAILAALRCALIALYVCIWHRCAADVAVVDLVSLPLVVFSLFRIPTLFYCHFPDKLLAQSLVVKNPRSRRSPIVSAYRYVIEAADALALRTAAHVTCNSQFTARAFATVFPKLPRPSVTYPCVSLPPTSARDGDGDGDDGEVCDDDAGANDAALRKDMSEADEKLLRDVVDDDKAPFFLSLNRYERKKNHALAVQALSVLRRPEGHGVESERGPDSDSESGSGMDCSRFRLVIAGGYDKRLAENVAVHRELGELAVELGVAADITLLRNVSDAVRSALLRNCAAVLYTPADEHFGIVPLEAMRAGRPVVAVRSGGPCESVADGSTGLLRDPHPNAFAAAMRILAAHPATAADMGRRGKQRVRDVFSRDAMGRQLDRTVRAIGPS